MEINKVAVLGSGIMGGGITQVLAQSGYEVVMRDIDEDILSKSVDTIEKNLDRQVDKEKISEEEKEEIINRISTTLELEEIEGSDLVIEAVPENLDLKKDTFEDVSDIVDEETIIASNTSSLPITELANSVEKPSRFTGMHFMNPVPVIGLVEIIKGLRTSDETLEAITELTEDIGKTPVTVEDSPAFALNRMLVPMINEAFFILQEGIASPEEIDQVMKLGANHPMGPLELGDLTGLDTLLHVMEILHEEFGEGKYRPCPLLRKYVRAGRLGKKTGEGVYSYD